VAVEIAGFTEFVEVGRGGQGRVYSAYDAALDRQVAVKVLGEPPSGRSDSNSERNARLRDALLAEGRVLAKIRGSADAWTVEVHGVEETTDGRPALVMELMESSLASLVERDDVTDDDLAKWVSQIASTLDAAHAQGIGHLDVKPSNVLLKDGNAHLADFTTEELERNGTRAATRGFAPAEQLEGRLDTNNRAAVARADVYGLAATAWTVETGEPPGYYRQPNTGGAQLPGRPDGMSDEVFGVYSRALHADPRKRFSSATEFASRLNRARRLGGETGHSDDGGLLIDDPEPVPRRRAGLRVGAGVLVLAIIGGLVTWFAGDSQAEAALVLTSTTTARSFDPTNGSTLAQVNRLAPAGLGAPIGSTGDWGMVEDDPDTTEFDWRFVVRSGRTLNERWSVDLPGVAGTHPRVKYSMTVGSGDEPTVVISRVGCPMQDDPSAEGLPVAWFVDVATKSVRTLSEQQFNEALGSCDGSRQASLQLGAVIDDTLYVVAGDYGSPRSLVAISSEGSLRSEKLGVDVDAMCSGVGGVDGQPFVACSGNSLVKVARYDPSTLRSIEEWMIESDSVTASPKEDAGDAVIVTSSNSPGAGTSVHRIRPGSTEVDSFDLGAQLQLSGVGVSEGFTFVLGTVPTGAPVTTDPTTENDRVVFRLGRDGSVARFPIRIDGRDVFSSNAGNGGRLEGVTGSGAVALLSADAGNFAEIFPAAGPSVVTRVAGLPVLVQARSLGGAVVYRPDSSTLSIIDGEGDIVESKTIELTQNIASAANVMATAPSSSRTTGLEGPLVALRSGPPLSQATSRRLKDLALVTDDAAGRNLYTVQFNSVTEPAGDYVCRQLVSRAVEKADEFDLDGPQMEPALTDIPCADNLGEGLGQAAIGFGREKMWMLSSDRNLDGTWVKDTAAATVSRWNLSDGRQELNRPAQGVSRLQVNSNDRAFGLVDGGRGGADLVEITDSGNRKLGEIGEQRARIAVDYCVAETYAAWVDRDLLVVQDLAGGSPVSAPLTEMSAADTGFYDLVCAGSGALVKGITSSTVMRLAPESQAPEQADLDVPALSRLDGGAGTPLIVVTTDGEVIGLNEDLTVRYRSNPG